MRGITLELSHVCQVVVGQYCICVLFTHTKHHIRLLSCITHKNCTFLVISDVILGKLNFGLRLRLFNSCLDEERTSF